MSEENRQRERDLVLSPNEFAYISDETKGHVDVYVGPYKTSLANTDQPVIFDSKTKKFRKVTLDQSIQTQAIAPEGWYLVIYNGSKNKDELHPRPGRSSLPALDVGRKINIPGPVSFALWPGQMFKVLQGHHLRSNQYLLVRVYDEDTARANWDNVVIKTADGKDSKLKVTPDQLSMGKLLVIKGTDVSFFIPPTGIEVVGERIKGQEQPVLVREAVTLERLEYCLLKDENGRKRYVRGPDVVFPNPTELFIDKLVDKNDPDAGRTKKFRAMELNKTSGIYIKVSADYTDEETGESYKQGEELFITGEDQMIYFPREEHSLIRYGEREIHYGIAIPAGEARYVLDRNTGVIALAKGPVVFLPDPTHQVVVLRVLDSKLCSLLYPGNAAALDYNSKLSGIDPNQFDNAAIPVAAAASLDYCSAANEMALFSSTEGDGLTKGLIRTNDARARRSITGPSAKGFEGDSFDRKNQYTAPRTVTLNSKFEGAVSIDVWSGFAVMLVSRSGARRVVVGPTTALLEYDEIPQVIKLSTGKPKTTDHLLSTAYLQIFANKISDIVTVETKDFCRLSVRLSYRVNFEGEPMKWFAIDNYVKYFTDNMRSRIRNAALKVGVQELYANYINILRDVIIGAQAEDGTRPGTLFEENGMHIYDVDVLGLVVEDKDVEKQLVEAQRSTISQTLSIEAERRKLLYTKEMECIKQQTQQAQFETNVVVTELREKEIKNKLCLDSAVLDSDASLKKMAHEFTIQQEKLVSLANGERLSRTKAEKELLLALEERTSGIRIKELEAEVQAVVEKAKAISPDFVAALAANGERETIQKACEALAPLGIIGGTSIVDALGKLLAGTNLGDAFKKMVLTGGDNGKKALPENVKHS